MLPGSVTNHDPEHLLLDNGLFKWTFEDHSYLGLTPPQSLEFEMDTEDSPSHPVNINRKTIKKS